MPEYRRVKIKGGMYFFTLVTFKRQHLFSVPQNRSLFYEAVNHVESFHPFSIKAYCLLPDHIHFLWSLPEGDGDFSMRIGLIKRYFSKQYNIQHGMPIQRNPSREKRNEMTIWQRRFWEHLIRDEDDLHHHIDYIHFNPVKHGLVNRVSD